MAEGWVDASELADAEGWCLCDPDTIEYGCGSDDCVTR